MTCKDCIHYDACTDWVPPKELLQAIKPEGCNKFKNKADFVEAEKYNELREDFIDFACSGVDNLAPYCKNRCADCVDERGWCRHGDSCKGFNPDGERK